MISPSMGTPLLQQIALMDNGVLDRIEETAGELVEHWSRGELWYSPHDPLFVAMEAQCSIGSYGTHDQVIGQAQIVPT